MRIVELESDDDIWNGRKLAQAHHTEFGTGREFDGAAIVALGLRCRNQEVRRESNCWIAYTDDDEPVGYLYATIGQSIFSFRRYAEQSMWFVLPKYRGTRAGIMLVKDFEDWAKSQHCESIRMGVMHTADAAMCDKVMRIINRLGYETCGSVAFKKMEN